MARPFEGDIPHQGVRNFLQSAFASFSGLAAGSDPTTLALTTDSTYVINGKQYFLPAADGVDFSAGEVQPTSSTVYYLVVVDAAGTVTTIQGDLTSQKLPEPPEGKAILGAVKIVTSAGATFTPGTTSLAAAGVTDTYADFGFYPQGGDASRFTFAVSVVASRFFTGVVTFVDVARASTANRIRLTGGANYFIKDQIFYKAATDNIVVSALAAQPDATTRYYLIQIDATGAVSVLAGNARRVPTPSTGNAALAVMKVVTNGATFTPGTTDLNAAGVTTTFANLYRWPRGGLTSELIYS